MSGINISLEGISLEIGGRFLLKDTDFKIADNHKYGLIGRNGSGKTTLLNRISNFSLKGMPKVDCLCVKQEVPGNMKTVFDTVLEANESRNKLIRKYKSLKNMVENSDSFSDSTLEEYNNVHEDLISIGADKDEGFVRRVLSGLGFKKDEQDRPTLEFSGGWRMRVSLAKALYMKPKLLLLDEPTNHLDLNATIWLTDYLSGYKGTLIVVSHDRKFLNEVCTDIIHLSQQRLAYYKGGYDGFLKGYEQNLKHLEKEWKKVEKRVKEMRKKGTPKNTVNEFIEGNIDKKPPKPYRVRIWNDYDLGFINPPVIKVDNLTFGYRSDQILLDGISFDINLDTRIAIVGKNGVGKSTLIKQILSQERDSLDRTIVMDNRVRVGYYSQHSSESLPLNKTPIEHLHDVKPELKIQEARKYLGSIGLEGNLHSKPIKSLSGGQRVRVAFVTLYLNEPHVIFLDEPTNHLDIETIDALIKSIEDFKGGVVMITHNIDLIERTECEIMELENAKLRSTSLEDYEQKVLEEVNEC